MAYTAKPATLPEFATAAASSTIIGSLDIDTIEFQATYADGARVRYTFNGSPDLSTSTIDHDLTVASAASSVNNGTFRILAVSNADDYIDVYNPNVTSNSTDAASNAAGTGTVVQSAARLVTPTSGRKSAGWRSPQKPNDGIFNWLSYWAYQWLNMLDQNYPTGYLLQGRLTAGTGIAITNNGDNTQLIDMSGFKSKKITAGGTWNPHSGLSTPHLARIFIEGTGITGGQIDLVIDGVSDTVFNDASPDSEEYYDVSTSISVVAEGRIDTLTQMNYTGNTYDATAQVTNARSVKYGDSDTKMYVRDGSTVYQYTLSTPGDISTASYASKSHNFGASFGFDFDFNSTGTKIFVLYDSGAANRVYAFPLSTAWDISTVGATEGFFSVGTDPEGLHMGNSDQSLYVTVDVNTIRQIDLSTPSDITTASNNGTYDVGADGVNPVKGITSTSDGTEFFLVEATTPGLMHRFTAGTAWDITTLTHSATTFDLSTQIAGGGANGIGISSDDRYIAAVDDTTTDIYQYDREQAFSGTVRVQILLSEND